MEKPRPSDDSPGGFWSNNTKFTSTDSSKWQKTQLQRGRRTMNQLRRNVQLSPFVIVPESFCEAVSDTALDHLHRQSKKLSNSTQWPTAAEGVCNASKICFAFALMTVSVVSVVELTRTRIRNEHEL
ncbi:unnamed protein product [Penicillium camemberti]|uniref:Str. FM013 n=1 Tax=Penicillium camemberti (strain FM 013) TaxID=1429867 RepID=A0A0G4PLH0_PENC3|nr:unnamed protein product [Penicillium camemberti]